MKKLSLSFAFVALVLAGCNSTQNSQVAAPLPSRSGDGYAQNRVTPKGFQLPAANGCSGEVSRYRAIMQNDYEMGQVNRTVFATITKEIDQAESACSAGQSEQAISLLRASKARHGYPEL